MTRRFLAVTVSLAATVAFLVGLVVAGSMTPAPAGSAPAPAVSARPASSGPPAAPVRSVQMAGAINFADIAERLNPAVVNIDAAARPEPRERRRAPLPNAPDLFEREPRERLETPRRGAGTGFVIDDDGLILTNHHVIEGAERITVRLRDGRQLRAERVGTDPETDVALIRVDAGRLTAAPLGDSDTLRVGEWVLAIGNPLAYEHTVTVGVVSFIGRKLFDRSLDRYIQTDAAINFGNSGGPLINARGEVIGINSAISSRAANIGFAVPINQAKAVLPQLRETGRVSRGYIGVTLRDVDPDIRESLNLASAHGALVQDVAPGSPGARAGLRTYDVIVGVDGRPVESNDALIALIAAREPGTVALLQVLRDRRSVNVRLKLAERPPRDRTPAADPERPVPSSLPGMPLGLSVRALDADTAARFRLPSDLQGVLVSRVEPTGPAATAAIERGHILLEINRRPVTTVDEYRRLAGEARPGDVLTLYVYKPELSQRTLETVRLDERLAPR